jgi:hypothetical protein
MRTIETTLEHIAHEVADDRLKCDIKWTQGFQANENDETAVRLIKTAVKENQFELMEKDNPFTWGRFRFYPTLSRCHVWAGIRNRFASFTILTTIFQTILLRLGIYFHHISKQITNAH